MVSIAREPIPDARLLQEGPVCPPVGVAAHRNRRFDLPPGAPYYADMPRKTFDIGLVVEELSILDESGRADAALDPKLPEATLLKMHRFMLLTRKLDERMIMMQRQGQMGTFAPGRGQEAVQIGSILPLRSEDWYSPSYRSFGAQLWRGWTIDQLLLLWAGYFEGFGLPEGVNDMPMSIVIGSHVPVAVGLGMSINYRGGDQVVLVNFGDGASSEGDVSEALNFAAVYKAPVIFLCENNGYAISVPLQKQCGVRSLAQRGIGFGMPSLRVDGNDVLAMAAAAQEAVDRARRHEGPTFIEAVTFRMEMHTTADDPKVYRSDEEVRRWEKKDPITRFETYLKSRGLLNDAGIDRVAAEIEEELRVARDRFAARAVQRPEEVFDFHYAVMPEELAEQKREYLADLQQALVEGK
ncbi:MAG: pyruvate dehydrogenase E1 component subunit alpha [Planctomycetota bacterium]|nr:MAG: pyruvate dehydrogenase E1 component subunit alpha [Planctomycetota bacterium]